MSFLILIPGLLLASCSAGDGLGANQDSGYSQVAKVESDYRGISEDRKVWVFKYDGSRQCGMGQAVSLEAMKKELGNVEVYGQEKKSDGLMRIQSCGSPTGYANAYQIDKDDLEKAKEKGFEPWSFD